MPRLWGSPGCEAPGGEAYPIRELRRYSLEELNSLMCELNLHVTEVPCLTDLLVISGYVKSKSEAKRLLRQGAIDIDGQTVHEDIPVAVSMTIRIGKYRGFKVVWGDKA